MKQRWKLGEYIFTFNPSQTNEQVDISTVDKVNVLGNKSNKVLFHKDSLQFQTLLHQRATHVENIISLPTVNCSSLCSRTGIEYGSGDEIYWTGDNVTGIIYQLDSQFQQTGVSFTLDPAYKDVRYLVDDGLNLFALINNFGILKLNYNGAIVSTFNYSADIDIGKKKMLSLTLNTKDNCLIGMTKGGIIYEIDINTGEAVSVMQLD